MYTINFCKKILFSINLLINNIKIQSVYVKIKLRKNKSKKVYVNIKIKYVLLPTAPQIWKNMTETSDDQKMVTDKLFPVLYQVRQQVARLELENFPGNFLGIY